MIDNTGTAFWATVAFGFDQGKVPNNAQAGWALQDQYDATYFSTSGHGTSDNIRSVLGRSDNRIWECSFNIATTGSQLPLLFGILFAASSQTAPALGTITGTIGYRSTDGAVLLNGTIIATYSVWHAGNTPCLAVDSSGHVWFGLDGAYNGSPAAGTGFVGTLGAGPYYAAVGVDDQGLSNVSVTGRFVTGSTIVAVPSGFSCWDA